LFNAILACLGDRAVEAKDVRLDALFRRQGFVARLVPGAVEAHHDAFHRGPSFKVIG
jgi:hypothetical protein